MAADTTYQPKVYKRDGGDTMVLRSGGAFAAEAASTPAPVLQLRTRVTMATINAGGTLLAAKAGYKYRLVDCLAIAYGGSVGTLTTVDVRGTQSASGVKLVAYGQASLTQSTVLRAGGTGATVLADGASFTVCDANTAITIGKTGGTGDTATGVDILLTYVIEVA